MFWSLHLPDGHTPDRAVAATLDHLDLARTVVAAHGEGLYPARTAGEVADARNRGRVAVLFGPATAAALGDSLGVLRSLYTLGLRVLSLTGVSWAGPAGLTRFGEETVREMNRLGMIADLSYASAPTIRRVLTLSKAPVLFSRSAACALRPHPANLPDDLLAEVARTRSLCMVPLAAEQSGPAVRDVADQLDHIRAIAGPECVGLSGTYDTGGAYPRELADPSCYPRLIAELLRRGWEESEVALLTWGNVQRVLRGPRSPRTRSSSAGPRPRRPSGNWTAEGLSAAWDAWTGRTPVPRAPWALAHRGPAGWGRMGRCAGSAD
ncbi:hypothetical protein SHKM778_85270 [Streptomyces sp. KM77-8]|uniref:Membrane dipeptidase n=1 Tax=Streptomyces haneummycinicus TaxID=3074435 RepID=A0AAT9HXR7_9ACTN